MPKRFSEKLRGANVFGASGHDFHRANRGCERPDGG
jgi:hypothetical protein